MINIIMLLSQWQIYIICISSTKGVTHLLKAKYGSLAVHIALIYIGNHIYFLMMINNYYVSSFHKYQCYPIEVIGAGFIILWLIVLGF